MPSLADLLRNDPWGAPPQTPLAKTVTDVGFDPSLGFAGAVQTYLSRLKQMQGGLAQDMLDTAADPNAEGIQRAANLLGGLGLKIANVPMALMPSAQELRDRGYQAGASPELQAVGGALGDMVNIPEPASVGTLLAGLGKAAVGAKGLAGAAAMAGKSAAVAPLGKGLAELLADATPAERLALETRLATEAKHADLPDTWYHGSPADIYGPDGSGKFRLTAGETGVPALWASSDPFSAEGYSRGEIALNYDDVAGKFPLTKSWYKDYDGNGGVYGLKSGAKNPLVVDSQSKQWVNANMGAIMRDAKAKGHDAVIFRNVADNYHSGGPSSDVIAFLDENAIRPDRKLAEAAQTGGQASAVSREQALNGLTGNEGLTADTIYKSYTDDAAFSKAMDDLSKLSKDEVLAIAKQLHLSSTSKSQAIANIKSDRISHLRTVNELNLVKKTTPW